MTAKRYDLALLVADKSMEHTVRAVLSRHQALAIRPITFRILQHPKHDPGVRSTGPSLLALNADHASHGMLVLDYEGSGASEGPEHLARDLDMRLEEHWGDRARSIVIDPKLETWLWGSDAAMRHGLARWTEGATLREWAASRGFEMANHAEPMRPKEALRAVMETSKTAVSAAVYAKIADRLSLAKCMAPSFVRMRESLQEWFPSS